MHKLAALFLIFPSLLIANTYWQQDVHYTINAQLDPQKHMIVGKEILHYQNNSPDVLNVVYFRLYWNLFTEGSYGQKLAESRKEYYSMSLSGMTIREFTIQEDGQQYVPEYSIDNTLMEVKLTEPLRPGESMTFLIEFEGKIPEDGERTGHQGKDYNIAQWYPQIATYDRFGWDKSQYLGPAEFHNEFGSFEVNITLPKSFTLGYSGALLNPEDVYPDSIITKLKQAEGDTVAVRIADYTKTEWGSAESTMVTWKFNAENVRDFAWSANEHYIWDVNYWYPSPGAKGIAVHALYFKDMAQYWNRAAEYAKHTISYLNNHYGMYAYPNCFVVEGVVGGGMEYPGITFIGHYGDELTNSPFGIITHEVAHNWYPMMVGTNETAYGFMDEGFATFFTVAASEDFYGRYNNTYHFTEWYQKLLHFPNADERSQIQLNSLWLAKSGYEEPIATHTYRFEEPGLSGASMYSKTATVLFMLQYVLGDEVFEKVMREYFNRWKFKHPYPEDFYTVVEEASGRKNLRWFFDQWFNKTLICDYGISGFCWDEIKSGDTIVYRTNVSVKRYKPAIMPVDVHVTMENGNDAVLWFPIDLWLNAEVERDTVIDLPSKPIRAELNPDGRILDINRLNNRRPLPKVSVEFENTLFGVTPVDAYLVSWRPSLWYTDRGGWNVGYKVNGSYLDDFFRARLWQAYNFGDKTFDHDVSLSHNTMNLTPGEISVRWYRMEGRKNVSFSLFKDFNRRYSYPPSHQVRLKYAFSKVIDRNYLLHPEVWEDGNLHSLIAGYSYSNRGSFWNVNASVQLEGSSSLFGRSSFQYSKRTFLVRSRFTMPGGWSLNARLYSGAGYGVVPAQAKFYFAGASPMEEMSDPLLRSKGVVPSTVRDHVVTPGGGMMRGYYRFPISGDKIEAVNMEARFSSVIPFVRIPIPVVSSVMRHFQSSLFLDAGRITGQTEKLWDRRFEIDFGFGLRLQSLAGLIGEFGRSNLFSAVGLQTLKIDFPLYSSAPFPGENKVKFRWVISFREEF